MPELNRPLPPKCQQCGDEIDERTLSHWTERGTEDHAGLCCDCYDVKLGKPPGLRNN